MARDAQNPIPGYDKNHFLEDIASSFETGSTDLWDKLIDAQNGLEKNPANPAYLASYQSKLQTYTLFRNAQTSTVKAYKDIAAAIIQNFR